ncbi:MAG: MATE family Na+-driven efflux transporter [Brevinema sp.]
MFQKINFRLYIVLCLTGLCPAIYTSLRFFYLNNLPSDSGLNIASQIQWLGTLIEVFQECLIVPLFYLLGQVLPNPRELVGRIKTSYLLIGTFFTLLAVFISLFAPNMLLFMENKTLLTEATTYIRWESLAFIFVMLSQINAIVFILLKKEQHLYMLLVIQMLLLALGDTFLLSQLPISLNLGVLGIAYNNLVSNAIIFGIGCLLINKDLNVLSSPADWTWMKDFLRTGMPAGLESLVRNLAYTIMIIKMMNMISMQGVYWQITSFFWVWLLLPVLKLGELIKRDVAEDSNIIHSGYKSYLAMTTCIVVLWLLCIPLYQWFLQTVLNLKEIKEGLTLTFILLPFYMVFAYGNIWTSYFYGLGKTQYLLWNTLLTNIIYYGSLYLLYLTGYFVPTLISVALMFGGGFVVSSIINMILFYRLRSTIKLLPQDALTI